MPRPSLDGRATRVVWTGPFPAIIEPCFTRRFSAPSRSAAGIALAIEPRQEADCMLIPGDHLESRCVARPLGWGTAKVLAAPCGQPAGGDFAMDTRSPRRNKRAISPPTHGGWRDCSSAVCLSPTTCSCISARLLTEKPHATGGLARPPDGERRGPYMVGRDMIQRSTASRFSWHSMSTPGGMVPLADRSPA